MPTTTTAKLGRQIALEMLTELENIEPITAAGSVLADTCQLEGKYRRGTPFRNIVAERLRQARAMGAEVESGFCAVLSHLVALNGQGNVVTAHDLQRVLRAVQS